MQPVHFVLEVPRLDLVGVLQELMQGELDSGVMASFRILAICLDILYLLYYYYLLCI